MATRKYIGARYVPIFADPLEWSAALNYENLTIVTDENGAFFVAKQYVPAGAPLTDTEYWIPWADWSGEISALDTRIDALEDALPIASFDDVNTVNARFDAIEDALPLSSFDDVNTVDARFDAIEDALPLSSFDDVNTVSAALSAKTGSGGTCNANITNVVSGASLFGLYANDSSDNRYGFLISATGISLYRGSTLIGSVTWA